MNNGKSGHSVMLLNGCSLWFEFLVRAVSFQANPWKVLSFGKEFQLPLCWYEALFQVTSTSGFSWPKMHREGPREKWYVWNVGRLEFSTESAVTLLRGRESFGEERQGFTEHAFAASGIISTYKLLFPKLQLSLLLFVHQSTCYRTCLTFVRLKDSISPSVQVVGETTHWIGHSS